MSTRTKLALLGLTAGVTLMGCHDDHNAPPAPPPTPSMTSFEGYSFQLVEQSTCDTTAPAVINGVDFVYNQDQDTASPRDLSAVTANCTS